MPARASYEVKIEGLLDGPPDKNPKGIARFQSDMRRPSSAQGGLNSVAQWPEGFWLNGYNICRWESVSYVEGDQKNTTLLSFYAEITFFSAAPLSEPTLQKRLLEDTTWYYKAKEHQWYTTFLKKLQDLNNDLPRLDGNRLIEELRFRESRWYCGDGGP